MKLIPLLFGFLCNILLMMILTDHHVSSTIVFTKILAGKKKFKTFSLGLPFLPTLVKVKPNKFHFTIRQNQYIRPKKYKMDGSLPLKVPTILMPKRNPYAPVSVQDININADLSLGPDDTKKKYPSYAASASEPEQQQALPPPPPPPPQQQQQQQSTPTQMEPQTSESMDNQQVVAMPPPYPPPPTPPVPGSELLPPPPPPPPYPMMPFIPPPPPPMPYPPLSPQLTPESMIPPIEPIKRSSSGINGRLQMAAPRSSRQMSIELSGENIGSGGVVEGNGGSGGVGVTIGGGGGGGVGLSFSTVDNSKNNNVPTIKTTPHQPMKINIGEHYDPNMIYMDDQLSPTNIEESTTLELDQPTQEPEGEPFSTMTLFDDDSNNGGGGDESMAESIHYGMKYPKKYKPKYPPPEDDGPDDIRVDFSLTGPHGGVMVPYGFGDDQDQLNKQLNKIQQHIPVGFHAKQIYNYYVRHTFTEHVHPLPWPHAVKVKKLIGIGGKKKKNQPKRPRYPTYPMMSV